MHKPPWLQYAILAVLFVMAAIYQVRWTQETLSAIIRPATVVRDPFSLEDGLPVLKTPAPEGKRAGLQEGDTLLAVNGRPFVGQSVVGRILASAHPADVVTFTVRSHGSAQRNVHVSLQQLAPETGKFAFNVVQVLLSVVSPLLSLLLGFWVALARPRDRLAWLLLAVMLGFTQIFGVRIERWQDGLRQAAIVYHTALNNIWPISMFLLGIYFPETFPRWRRQWLFKLLTWLALIPLAILCVLHLIASYGEMENYAQTASVQSFLLSVKVIDTTLTFIAIGTFFGAMGTKYGMASSKDSKRRLLLLYCGTSLALTPIFILTLISLAKGRPVDQVAPGWVILPALLLISMFPLTLAYVIVVQKAMDVRVVVRQGLQYALAKNGVLVLQVAVSAVVTLSAFRLATDAHRNQLQKLLVIALGGAAIFMMRRGAEKLRAWTDHRFFRDAYNAEQILSELSESVRGFVEARPLLETVSRRIAESLHVGQVAVLLNGSGPYRPAYALGYEPAPNVMFSQNAGTVKQLRTERRPARVYLQDPDSWVNRAAEVAPEERTQLLELRSELLLPLAVRDHLLGFISLGQKRSEEPYSGSDLRLLQSVASQTGMALENARLTSVIAQEMAEREKLNREMEIARAVQERLFPQHYPTIHGLDYCGKCRPALGVGGDYYDFLVLPQGRLGIAIGDVSGKGISAALTMASLQASLRGQVLVLPENLAGLMSNVNRLVYEASSSNRYATFFYAQYDPASRRLTYVNAGHNPPVIMRKADGGFRLTRLEEGGTVVGLLPSFEYKQGSVDMQPGDLLVAYTDGISEAMNAADDEWGEENMLRSIEQSYGLAATEIINRVMSEAQAFANGAPQNDDMTLVVVRAT